MSTPSPDAVATSRRIERQDLAAEIGGTHNRLLSSALLAALGGVATAVAIAAGSGGEILTAVAMGSGAVGALRQGWILRRQRRQLAELDAGAPPDVARSLPPA